MNEHRLDDIRKKPLPLKLYSAGWLLIAAGMFLYVLGYSVDKSHAVFVNLINFLFLTSIGVGSLFFIALEYLAGAVWSVPMRRVNEFLAALIPFAVLLAIPVIFNLTGLYRWSSPSLVSTDSILQSKSPYLNINFFIYRFIAIYGCLTVLQYILKRNSILQDDDKNQIRTSWNIRVSALFMPIFAFGVTIISIDWAMSLEPHWYSTIFGVYYFSGVAIAGISSATFCIILLHEHGYLPQLKRGHFYNLGTLMFVFVNFWAYIAFSQFMLIWYANIPEETIWFVARWRNGWEYISVLLIIMNFAVPYFALLSQNAKMKLPRLKFIAVWMMLAHLLDIYWLVMPTYSASPIFGWMELGFPVLIIGLAITVFGWKMKRYNLIPVGDPKLKRGLEFHI